MTAKLLHYVSDEYDDNPSAYINVLLDAIDELDCKGVEANTIAMGREAHYAWLSAMNIRLTFNCKITDKQTLRGLVVVKDTRLHDKDIHIYFDKSRP